MTLLTQNRKGQFTYHIVNIKQKDGTTYVLVHVLFTYHIVNIKHNGQDYNVRITCRFTYHIVNIKQDEEQIK